MASDAQLRTRLARLLAEVTIDARALDARAAEINTLLAKWHAAKAIERAELMLVAANLHGYYTALETLCERIARQLDENVPAGPTWHTELVAQMQVEVPGLRPRVIAAEVLDDLHELRKFRHFFRNAYVLDFDPILIKGHAERVHKIHDTVAREVATVRVHIDQLLRTLSH